MARATGHPMLSVPARGGHSAWLCDAAHGRLGLCFSRPRPRAVGGAYAWEFCVYRDVSTQREFRP